MKIFRKRKKSPDSTGHNNLTEISRSKTWLFTCIPLVLLVLIIILTNLVSFRLDLTREKVFTISGVSKQVFNDIEDPVSVTYLVSDRLVREIPEIQNMVDILNEYARYGGRKMNLRIVDPENDPDLTDPTSLGIQPQQYQVIEENEQRVAQVYTGLVINYQDQQSVIPAIADPGSLEYQLTTAIRDITRGERRSIGILLGDQDRSLDQNYAYLNQELSRIAEVRSINPGERIPETLDSLFVIGQKDLNEQAVYQIDQFILSGKGVFLAYDPIGVDLEQNLAPVDNSQSIAFQALASYGVVISPEWVMDRSNQPIPIQQVRGNMRINTYEPYPLWVSTTNAAENHPITARFAGMDLFWASPVSFDQERNPEANFEELVLSSKVTGTMGAPYQTDPAQVGYLTSSFQEKQQTLAGSLLGPVSSYFPQEPQGENPVHRSSTENARLIVMGDSDFLTNLIQINRSTYNLQFALSAFEWLSHDEDLLNLRTRQIRNTRLDSIEDPELRTAYMTWAKIMGIAAAPVIVLLFALVRLISRRRRA